MKENIHEWSNKRLVQHLSAMNMRIETCIRMQDSHVEQFSAEIKELEQEILSRMHQPESVKISVSH